jgi:hypothetical protein
MSPELATEFGIRRWYIQEEEILASEAGHPATGAPSRKIVIAACVKNPYANGRFSADLGDVVKRSPALGLEMGRRALAALGGQAFESYGKACIVGTEGEYEHGNAFLTATMMDPLRELLGGGLAWVPSTGKRGGPGTTIDVPLAHRDALYVRSHYDTITATFHDGPNPDEILVVFALATAGRLHARLGGLRSNEIRVRDGLR